MSPNLVLAVIIFAVLLVVPFALPVFCGVLYAYLPTSSPEHPSPKTDIVKGILLVVPLAEGVLLYLFILSSVPPYLFAPGLLLAMFAIFAGYAIFAASNDVTKRQRTNSDD